MPRAAAMPGARRVYRGRAVLNKDRCRAIARCAAAALAGSVLAGCVLDRVMATHDQLCASSPREVVVAFGNGEGFRVDFARPTLTRDDVEWLVGLPPTRTVVVPGGVRLVYVASPSGRPPAPAESIASELVFRDVDGVPKLAATVPPARIAALVPRELVDATIATICRPEISLAPPGVRFDLDTMPRAAFPDEARIVAQLGPPHFREGASFGYRFCLEPCDPRTRPIAQFVYTAGGDGRLRRATLAYFRYQLDVDLPSRVATLSLRL